MSELNKIPLKRSDGAEDSLASHAGKVLLIVNVASKCGLTPQYAGLKTLYKEKRAHGLEIMAFPSNDFKGQELGTDEEINSFCSLNYDVTFPLYSKIFVLGEAMHPLYAALIKDTPENHRRRPVSREARRTRRPAGAQGRRAMEF